VTVAGRESGIAISLPIRASLCTSDGQAFIIR
jgi:hypothetical protein